MVSAEDKSYVRQLFPEVEEIADRELADKVVEIWGEIWKESTWRRIEDAPKNPENVPLHHTLVAHTRSVAQQAIAVARCVRERHKVEVNMDILIAGALLHDASKLLEYEAGADGQGHKAPFGKLVQHAIYGVHKAFAKGLPLEVVHLINSHTKQSRLHPATMEGVILHYVDYCDSDVLLQGAGQPLLLAT